jgi:hypothetical protein
MDIVAVVSVLIAILSIVVVGAIGFWAIERIVVDRRLALLHAARPVRYHWLDGKPTHSL